MKSPFQDLSIDTNFISVGGNLSARRPFEVCLSPGKERIHREYIRRCSRFLSFLHRPSKGSDVFYWIWLI